MFGSGVLDTAIGLVFVFLLVSLLVTIGNELISAILLSRAKWLRVGIDRLLGSEWAQKLYDHPLIEGSAAVPGSAAPTRWSFRGSGPSYIPSRSFANVLLGLVRDGDSILSEAQKALQIALDGASSTVKTMDELQKQLREVIAGTPSIARNDSIRKDLTGLVGGLQGGTSVGEASKVIQGFIDGMQAKYLRDVIQRVPSQRISQSLLALLDDAQDDVEKLKQNIEIWFDHAMDRVNGWYKRRSQWVIVGLGSLIVVTMNVDSMLIVKHLETHPGQRDALVAQARAYAEVPTSTDSDLQSRFSEVQGRLGQLGLPIGWVRKPTQAEHDNRQDIPGTLDAAWDAFAFHFFGWFITVLAATLGAPFWFDMLNRIISIRSAGKAPEERPKPPKEVPIPLEPGQTPREADLASAGRGR